MSCRAGWKLKGYEPNKQEMMMHVDVSFLETKIIEKNILTGYELSCNQRGDTKENWNGESTARELTMVEQNNFQNNNQPDTSMLDKQVI